MFQTNVKLIINTSNVIFKLNEQVHLILVLNKVLSSEVSCEPVKCVVKHIRAFAARIHKVSMYMKSQAKF